MCHNVGTAPTCAKFDVQYPEVSPGLVSGAPSGIGPIETSCRWCSSASSSPDHPHVMRKWRRKVNDFAARRSRRCVHITRCRGRNEHDKKYGVASTSKVPHAACRWGPCSVNDCVQVRSRNHFLIITHLHSLNLGPCTVTPSSVFSIAVFGNTNRKVAATFFARAT